MQFEYNRDLYIALRYTDDKSVELYKEQCPENKEIYKNIADFKTNAQIDGKHLKLIWKDVKNADWLDQYWQCSNGYSNEIEISYYQVTKCIINEGT